MSTETTGTRWRKSSHSAQGANCVEIADVFSERAVRDSKDPDGPTLTMTLSAWTTLLSTIKAGAHDLA